MAINLNFNLTKNAKIILDQHNADELMWEHFTKKGYLPGKIIAKLNLNKLKRFQTQIFNYIDIVISVSEKEAKFMKARVPKSCQVWVAPNGIDTEYFNPKAHSEFREKDNIILFCGAMDVKMNIDAVIFFTNNILPLVKTLIPDVKFLIVGRNPESKVKNLNNKKEIKVTGTVKDVRPYYEKAKVVIAPFRFGAGTKLKILEAMAMKIPIVSTSIGCQGIEIENGKHLFIEDDNKKFAKKIIDIFQSKNIRRSTINEARKLVESRYSWESIFQKTMKQFEKEV